MQKHFKKLNEKKNINKSRSKKNFKHKFSFTQDWTPIFLSEKHRKVHVTSNFDLILAERKYGNLKLNHLKKILLFIEAKKIQKYFTSLHIMPQ